MEYTFFLIFLRYFKLIPSKCALNQLKLAFLIFGYWFGVRKKVVHRQLQLIFPDKDSREIRQLVKEIFYELAVTTAETFVFDDTYFIDKSEVIGIDNINKALDYGRGVIIMSAHFGSWELAVKTLAKNYKNVYGVVKDQKNPYFNNYINKKRTETGMEVIEMKNALKHVILALQKNYIVVLAVDQYAFKQGVEIDFLGHQTKSYTSVAQIAIKYKTPVISAFTIREKNGNHRTIFHEPKVYDNIPYTSEEIVKLTKLLNQDIEKYILTYPNLWFWVHKKWRQVL